MDDLKKKFEENHISYRQQFLDNGNIIKPCPHCGSVEIDTQIFAGNPPNKEAICRKCGSKGFPEPTAYEAYKAWNMRHEQ